MKLILALGVFNSCTWAASAFVVPAPKGFASKLGVGVDESEAVASFTYNPYAEFAESLPEAPLPVVDESQSSITHPSNVDARLAEIQSNVREARLAELKAQEQKAQNGKKKSKKASGVTVQGGALRTWTFMSPSVERVQVTLTTDGRPIDADIDLWQGPDNIPAKMRIYTEDGSTRPLIATIATPKEPNTIAIRNTAQMEFPLTSHVKASTEAIPPMSVIMEESDPSIIQGGSMKTYPFDPIVKSVQVLLTTDGRPLNARIELLQGPNNNKQVIELYTENGLERPFMGVFATPGHCNTVRVVNTATIEFPLLAVVEPFMVARKRVPNTVNQADAPFMLDSRKP